MTVAICVACGARKFGAFVVCGECGFAPRSSGEQARSVMLSDHHLDENALVQVSATIRAGQEVEFAPELLQAIVSAFDQGPSQDELVAMWDRDAKRFRRRIAIFIFLAIVLVAGVFWISA